MKKLLVSATKKHRHTAGRIVRHGVSRARDGRRTSIHRRAPRVRLTASSILSSRIKSGHTTILWCTGVLARSASVCRPTRVLCTTIGEHLSSICRAARIRRDHTRIGCCSTIFPASRVRRLSAIFRRTTIRVSARIDAGVAEASEADVAGIAGGTRAALGGYGAHARVHELLTVIELDAYILDAERALRRAVQVLITRDADAEEATARQEQERQQERGGELHRPRLRHNELGHTEGMGEPKARLR